jgi:predicted DsbA family dithiol-disulfide isomerase
MPSSNAEPIIVDVWSDVVCPFCYLGHAVLTEAIEQFRDAEVEVRYHSFQLNPGFPAGESVLADDYVANQYGMPKSQLAASHEQLAARGAQSGLDYRFESALMVNTLDAHRMTHLAKAYGRETAMVQRLFRAEFTDGLDLADHAVLADLAAEVGLDRAEAIKTLETRGYEDDIRHDLSEARQLGISGVPFFVFDNKRAVSGAQPLELFRQALDVTWQDRADQPA